MISTPFLSREPKSTMFSTWILSDPLEIDASFGLITNDFPDWMLIAEEDDEPAIFREELRFLKKKLGLQLI